MAKWHAPLDPTCPEVIEYRQTVMEDMFGRAMGAPLDEFFEDFERKHRKECIRCQEFGVANIEVV
jgi:hypothetical protein